MPLWVQVVGQGCYTTSGLVCPSLHALLGVIVSGAVCRRGARGCIWLPAPLCPTHDWHPCLARVSTLVRPLHRPALNAPALRSLYQCATAGLLYEYVSTQRWACECLRIFSLYPYFARQGWWIGPLFLLLRKGVTVALFHKVCQRRTVAMCVSAALWLCVPAPHCGYVNA